MYLAERIFVIVAISKQIKNALRTQNITLWNSKLKVAGSVWLQMLQVMGKSLWP